MGTKQLAKLSNKSRSGFPGYQAVFKQCVDFVGARFAHFPHFEKMQEFRILCCAFTCSAGAAAAAERRAGDALQPRAHLGRGAGRRQRRGPEGRQARPSHRSAAGQERRLGPGLHVSLSQGGTQASSRLRRSLRIKCTERPEREPVWNVALSCSFSLKLTLACFIA